MYSALSSYWNRVPSSVWALSAVGSFTGVFSSASVRSASAAAFSSAAVSVSAPSATPAAVRQRLSMQIIRRLIIFFIFVLPSI